MSKNLAIVKALLEVEHRLFQPGVLQGRQRSPDFLVKVMEVAELVLVRHIRPVCEIARLQEDHRLPFARRAVQSLCGVAEWSIQRIIKILERIGFFCNRSPLERWCKGNARSITPGAKPYWFRPTLFSIGATFVVILMGGINLAASLPENRSTPDVIPNVGRIYLDDRTSQTTEQAEEYLRFPIRSTSNPSIQIGFDIDDDDDVVAPPVALPSGPKIRIPVSTLPVVEARPQPTPAKPLTEFDLNLLRILREVEEKGKAARGG